ncbi:hypothetical protein BDV19DRAFT_398724 [Aspergillus venezuelensis]
MSSRRRNGQAASCEPCRKDKVRCDHGVPTCGRCQKRNTESRCYYHPAPLTREGNSSAARFRTQRTPRPAGERSLKATQSPAPAQTSPTPSFIEITIRTPVTDESLPRGYYGPTSFESAFTGISDSMVAPLTGDSQPGHGHSVLPLYWVAETTKILGILAENSPIEDLVTAFYDASQAAIVPSPFIFKYLEGMRDIIEKGDSPEQLHKKTIRILENTARRFHIPSDIKGKDFHTLSTGSQMRLEIIGLVYSLAGRASFFGLSHAKFPGSAGAASRAKFARKMLMATDTVIQVCKMLTPVNDMLVWLQYENWLLACLFYGDISSPTWHRLGEVASSAFELGLHRDCHKDAPVFLREIRRRVYAGVYYIDKNIATFLGRPPRVSWRYADTKAPLDLDEDAFVADEEEFEKAVGELDSEGWNTKPIYLRSSWYRIRHSISIFREELLELSLRPIDAEAAERLRDISFRCTTAWDSVPDHLRYAPHGWSESLTIGVRILMIMSYQLYLYNIFLVQRLLCQFDSSAETALLDVSSELLSTVLVLGRQPEAMVDIKRDYNSIIVMCGFSSASTLIKALQTQVRTGNPLPYSGSRAELIRNLSVFVSHIEIMARPLSSNTNHALFDRASKIFANILDEVLEARLPPLSATTNTAEVDMRLNAAAEEDLTSSWAADGMEFLDTLDFGAVFDQWVF